MKKKIALLLSVAMLAVSLAGCGGGKTSSGSDSGSQAAGGSEAGAGAGSTAAGHKDSLIIGTDADINNLDLQQHQIIPAIELSRNASFRSFALACG